MLMAVDLSVAAPMRGANVDCVGHRTPVRLRALLGLVVFTLAPATAWTDPTTDAQGRFMASTKTAAANIRASAEYVHPHCDFDALIVGNGIVRVAQASMTALKPDDLVIAVNGSPVDPKDPHGVWTMLKTHAPTEVVTLSISRDGSFRKVRVRCQSSNDDVAPHLAALDAAAIGDFKNCASILREANRRLPQANNYRLQTNCERFSGELSSQDAATRLVQFWALLFQELVRYSDQIEDQRPQVVGNIQFLAQSGQDRLAAELSSMFSKATGTPLSSIPPVAGAPVDSALQQAPNGSTPVTGPNPAAVSCEQLADIRYPPIADNTQELLARARNQLAQNAAGQENLAAARAMSNPGGSGSVYSNALGAAADQQRATQDQLLQYDLEISRQQRVERQSEHDAFLVSCRASGQGH
jgi:hypothetical protein